MLQVRRHCLYDAHSKIAHCSFYDFSQIYVMDCLSQCLFLDSFIALTPQRILRRLPSNLSGHQIPFPMILVLLTMTYKCSDSGDIHKTVLLSMT